MNLHITGQADQFKWEVVTLNDRHHVTTWHLYRLEKIKKMASNNMDSRKGINCISVT